MDGAIGLVEPSGDYGTDTATGADYARRLMPMLKYNIGISMLAWIVLDMIEARAPEKHRGLVIGFFGELARELACVRAIVEAATENRLPWQT
jgi:hypothetical protein